MNPAPSIAVPRRARAALSAALPLKRTVSGLILREADYGPMHGRDRNAPCPCKNGRKWKRCHGRGQ